MSAARDVDARDFAVLQSGREAPIYWGICGMILVESVVFASLLSSYLYLPFFSPEWPPPAMKKPDLLLPSINTGILVVSSSFVHKADTGIRRGDQRWLKVGLSVGLVLALVFLGIKYVEYSGVGYRWDSHAYGSIVWTITGFHSAHVIALVLKTVVVLVLAFRGYFDERRNVAVQVNGLYWHFVAAVWLPIYAVLYYGPRVLE